MLTSASDATTAIGPGLDLDVTGNHCIRTISVSKPVQYSALGSGQMFTRYDYLNPVLGQAELQADVNGVHISSAADAATLLRQVSVTGNQVVGVASSVMIDRSPQIIGGEISRNEFYDFLNYGSISRRPRRTIGCTSPRTCSMAIPVCRDAAAARTVPGNPRLR